MHTLRFSFFFVFFLPSLVRIFAAILSVGAKHSIPLLHRLINRIVASADQALRSGYVADDSEFCFLSPRTGDPLDEHSLMGLTYMEALSWEGNRFQQVYQGLIYRTTRSILLFCIALWRTLSMKLRALLRAVLLPLIVAAISTHRFLKELRASFVRQDVPQEKAAGAVQV